MAVAMTRTLRTPAYLFASLVPLISVVADQAPPSDASVIGSAATRNAYAGGGGAGSAAATDINQPHVSFDAASSSLFVDSHPALRGHGSESRAVCAPLGQLSGAGPILAGATVGSMGGLAIHHILAKRAFWAGAMAETKRDGYKGRTQAGAVLTASSGAAQEMQPTLTAQGDSGTQQDAHAMCKVLPAVIILIAFVLYRADRRRARVKTPESREVQLSADVHAPASPDSEQSSCYSPSERSGDTTPESREVHVAADWSTPAGPDLAAPQSLSESRQSSFDSQFEFIPRQVSRVRSKATMPDDTWIRRETSSGSARPRTAAVFHRMMTEEVGGDQVSDAEIEGVYNSMSCQLYRVMTDFGLPASSTD